MTVVFNDTFTEVSDTTLASHTPDTGTSWTDRSNGTPLLEVSAATDVCSPDASQNGKNTSYEAIYTVGTADYDVEVDITVEGPGNDDAAGVLARFTDSANLWAIRVFADKAGNDAYIGKKVTSTRTIVSSTDTDNDWTTGRLKFQLRGSILTFLFDDAEISEIDDADHENAIEPGGLYCGNILNNTNDINTLWAFDNFTITEPDVGVAIHLVMAPYIPT